MRCLVLVAAMVASTVPVLAQENADGEWACKTLMEITPVAYLTLSGSTYGLTRADGTQGKGTVIYTDSPIIGFVVNSGPLLEEFDAGESILMGSDRLMFDAVAGGIALMCEPGRRAK